MRFNKIFAGPATEVLPQVIEAVAGPADVKPGQIVTFVAGQFDQAGAATQTQLLIVQDNYLAMLGVDDAYEEDETVIGLIPLDDQLFNVRFAAAAALNRGDKVVLAANGLLQKLPAAAATYIGVGYADETVTVGASEDLVRIRWTGPHPIVVT